MFNISSCTVWKNKKHGNFVTLASICSDETVTIRDNNAEEFKISVKEFIENFEEVFVDVKKYKDQIAEACEIDENFRNLAMTLMRRLEPGYLKEGALVYFIEPGAFFKRDTIQEYGPRYPYVITKIRGCRNYYGYSNHLEICLNRKGKKIGDPEFILPVYLDRIVPGDAFWYLKRYDKAF